jgi:hypothetical protein
MRHVSWERLASRFSATTMSGEVLREDRAVDVVIAALIPAPLSGSCRRTK